MDAKIIWTERASSDIEAIVRYIARRNPGAANRIGLGIYDRVQILVEKSHPWHGDQATNLRCLGYENGEFVATGSLPGP